MPSRPFTRRCIATLAALMTSVLVSPLYAQDTNIPAGFASFQAYEEAMFERIDELAVRRGADIARIHAMRDGLRAEYEAARLRNDAEGMAEARALQAHLITISLERLSQ